MIFFKQCKSILEVQALYNQVAKLYLPECGGNEETMQIINLEYSVACENFILGNDEPNQFILEQIEDCEDYKKLIQKIILLKGITIEVVGSWVWVNGDAFAVSEKLAKAGFKFSSKRLMWYYPLYHE